MSDHLHVVLGVVVDGEGRVLISHRSARQHQGERWEFPGGKVEPGEVPLAALSRELHEEVGITPESARPLIRIRHAYADRSVDLEVFRVERFGAEAVGREGQALRWLPPEQLEVAEFPAANRPIIAAVQLPSHYLITPEPDEPPPWRGFLARLDSALDKGIRLVQLRAHTLNDTAYAQLAELVAERITRAGAKLLLNRPASERWLGLGHGIHLTRHQLKALEQRPSGLQGWLAASCHEPSEIAHAARIGVDFCLLSPVAPTASHPGEPVLGWPRFAEIVADCNLPVYALGGMCVDDVQMAWAHGGQGIAAIRALWPSSASGTVQN